MNIIKIVDASTEPLGLPEVKRQLREDLVDANNDADILALITVARMAAEDRTNRTLMPTTWEISFDEFPPVIQLPRPPIISVVSLKYIDTSGVQQTLAPSSYLVDTASEPGRVVPAYGTSWPSVRCQPGAVVVRYQAGYADASKVPGPIKQWMKLAITDMYETREGSAERGKVAHDFAEHLLDLSKIWSI